MKRTIVHARVRVIVELDVTDVWGGDCPVSQVYKQATNAALARVRMLKTPDQPTEPKVLDAFVTAVIVSEEA